MRNIIKTILSEWKSRKLPKIIQRDMDIESYLKVTPNKIIAISGFRRVGKTYLLYQVCEHLLHKYSRNEVVYINLEDERIPEKIEFLSELVPALIEVNGKLPVYLFLDEIQVIPDWSKWIRRMYDQYNMRLLITGSSSELTSDKLPAELRGRSLELWLGSLSLKEYLRFKNIVIDSSYLDYPNEQLALFHKTFNLYITQGGLPEIALMDEDKILETVQSYYKTVVQRDIIEKAKIKNDESMKQLLKLLLGSTEYTISRLHNNLKSMGVTIAKNTISQYINHIESSFFLYSLQALSYNIKDAMMHPRKAYFIDNAFISFITTKFSHNFGRLYENVVASCLKKKYMEVFYWKSSQDNYEVDFVIKDGLRIIQLIQVCYSLENEQTKNREIRALIHAGKELKSKKLLILTYDYEATENVTWFGMKAKIEFFPLWKWFLKT